MSTPSSEPVLDLAERALRHADGPAQVTVTRERSLLSRFARSSPTQATAVDDTGVEILVLRDGHPGLAETNDLSDDGLRRAARAAAEAADQLARTSGRQGDHPGLQDPPPGGYRTHHGLDLQTAANDPRAATRALTTAVDLCAEHRLEAFGAWSTGYVENAIATSTGLRASDAVTDAFCKVIARDPDTGWSGWGADAAVAAKAIDPAKVARDAIARTPREQPIGLGPGAYPVVLAPDAVGLLLDALAGLAFDGRAHVEGHGALSGRLGQRVAAARINLSDSPRFARTLPRAFDAEGTPKRPLPLIQDGVAHRVVHDRRSAAAAGGGVQSTGHAVDPAGAHGPHPTNLVLIGGDAADLDELARPVERGLLVTRLWYLNPVHARTATVTGTSRDGTFLIEDGRITRPVRDVRFTDSALRLLEATEALTATSRLVVEGEFYGRRSTYGIVCPGLRAHGFVVTGQTPA